MNLQGYKELIEKNGFIELPKHLYFGTQVFLDDFLDYSILEFEVKIHICEMLIVKCLPPDNGLILSRNITWFVKQFLSEFNSDLFNPANSPAIKEAIKLVLSIDTFGKRFVGTVFMYRTIEYYAKAMLGHLDQFGRLKTEKLNTKSFLIKLRKSNFGISRSINHIDKMNKKKYSFGINNGYISKFKIEDRYTSKRNNVMHGGNENSTEGLFLVCLYMLMHWNKIVDESIA